MILNCSVMSFNLNNKAETERPTQNIRLEKDSLLDATKVYRITLL